MSALRSLYANRISTLALRHLQRSSTGRILHVFPAGCYAKTSAGDVIVLTSETAPFGPLSISVPGMAAALAGLSPGLRLRWAHDGLHLGETEVRLARARAWDPYPPWTSLRPRLAADPGMVERLRSAILELAPPRSLADLLGPPSAVRSDFLVEAARPRVVSILTAVRAVANEANGAADTELRRAASGLAGLGAGFTPAGDDFMMGTMHAAWALLEPGVAASIGQVVQEAAGPLTTSASAAYLRAAADGAAGQLWHELIGALGQGDDRAIDPSSALHPLGTRRAPMRSRGSCQAWAPCSTGSISAWPTGLGATRRSGRERSRWATPLHRVPAKRERCEGRTTPVGFAEPRHDGTSPGQAEWIGRWRRTDPTAPPAGRRAASGGPPPRLAGSTICRRLKRTAVGDAVGRSHAVPRVDRGHASSVRHE
jgi:hypothetical protein